MRKLSGSLLLIVATAAAILAAPHTARAQGTAFIYRGQLSDGSGPVTGTYDLMFTLYGASTGGSAVAGPAAHPASIVNNGDYAVVLDFGAVFDGSSRWLEIAVQTNGGTGFITLSPRQPLLAVPYAITANSASNLLGTLPTAQLSGTVPLEQLPAGILTNNASGISLQGFFNGYHFGDGGLLTNLNPQGLSPGYVAAAVQFTNGGNSFQGFFNGYHFGDGGLLTNLNPQALSSGYVGAQLWLTNGYNNFNGSFYGDGSGLTNITGATGPAGPQGFQGLQGPQGIQGVAGISGTNGLSGINGTNGLDGATGPAGSQGLTGPQGPQGPTGPVGTFDSSALTNYPTLNGNNLLTGTNAFSGQLLATNVNNVFNGTLTGNVTGTISGNGSGLTNLPTTQTYLYSYDTNNQALITAGTFQDITFANDGQISGWSHTSGNAAFTNGPAGLYLIEYTAETSIANNGNSTVSVHALLNGTEIAGSQSVSGLSNSGLPIPLSKSFIARIPTASTNVLKLQFTGSSSNNRLLAGSGVGNIRPSVSLTIIRIQ
jgi:hypothetical protein